MWNEASDGRQQVASDLKRLGDLRMVTLVERSEEQGRRVYRYRLDFTNASVINRFEFTADGKLAYAASECIELKPEALRPDGK